MDRILNSQNDRIRRMGIQYSVVYRQISWILTYWQNIHLVYCQISRVLTEYWIVGMIGLGGLESNIQWCIVGLAGYWQNIHSVYCWISQTLTKYCGISRALTEYWIVRMIGLGGLESNIQWCIVGLAGHWLNIHSVYCWISQTVSEYSLGVCRIRQTLTEYSLGVLSD
jgi:uncharacterized membrane protein YuzA (DUF378 family)